MTALINLLTEETEQFLLILEDYHLIIEQQIHTNLSYLVEHLPSQLHIILSTRIDPPLPLSQLRAASWPQRRQLIQHIRRQLSSLPLRNAYYPGSQQCYQEFIAAHPDAEQPSIPNEQQLPWTLITDVDATNAGDICFSTEAFCSLFAETGLTAESVVECIDLANERL